MRGRRIPDDRRAKIVARYEQGYSQGALAEHFGHASSTIYAILVEAGTPIRANGSPRKLKTRTIVVDGRKSCSRCGQLKELDEFTPDEAGQAGRKSCCRACERKRYAERMNDPAWVANRRERWTQLMRDPARRADRRERQRFEAERRRREAGIRERKWGPRNGRGKGGADPRIACAPLREAVDRWLAADPGHSKEGLARCLGVSSKRVTTLLEQVGVTQSVADRVCVAIGVHLNDVYR